MFPAYSSVVNHTQVPAITLGPRWAIFCREWIVRRLLPTIRVRRLYIKISSFSVSRDPVTATDHRILFSISSWPFVHWPCSGGGNQEPGWVMVTSVTRLPCVSPPIYPGHISDSHSRHDLFWSTRFCISWTPWIHAVHCGPRLNVSWDFYGHRAKVPRLHIVNDNLKGIRNSARENIFSLTKHLSDSRRAISSLTPLSEIACEAYL